MLHKKRIDGERLRERCSPANSIHSNALLDREIPETEP
jgi:hypothetical protein